MKYPQRLLFICACACFGVHLAAQDFVPQNSPASASDKALLPLLRAAPDGKPDKPALLLLPEKSAPAAGLPAGLAPAAVGPAGVASQPAAGTGASVADAIKAFNRGENPLERNLVVAFYGHPSSKYMGILGEYPLADMASRLKANAAEWDKLNGERGVIPAFHLIYAVAAPGGELAVMGEKKVREYIEFAQKNDILVFLDHQIGKLGVSAAVNSLLPFLKYENVHLAIDPEWCTDKPNEELGFIQAEDLNQAQKIVQDYLKAQKIPGKRMFMVHQFNWKMIGKREKVKADQPDVLLIHNADGFGTPEEKQKSYAFNKRAVNMPLKGFKLFLAKDWRKGGFDVPLLSPTEVLALDPPPVLVMYQ
jgi:hypothetical protein